VLELNRLSEEIPKNGEWAFFIFQATEKKGTAGSSFQERPSQAEGPEPSRLPELKRSISAGMVSRQKPANRRENAGGQATGNKQRGLNRRVGQIG